MYADRDRGASGRILTVVGFAVLMATLTVVNIGDSGVLADLALGDVLTVTSSAAFVDDEHRRIAWVNKFAAMCGLEGHMPCGCSDCADTPTT